MIAARWKVNICRYYTWIQLLHLVLIFSFPLDYGRDQSNLKKLVTMSCYMHFVGYAHGFWSSVISISAFSLYTETVVPVYIYNAKLGFGAYANAFIQLLVLFSMGVLYYALTTWIGDKFVAAELPRHGNEKLLNGLKESVFIALFMCVTVPVGSWGFGGCSSGTIRMNTTILQYINIDYFHQFAANVYAVR